TSAAVALFLVTGFAVTAALSFAFCWARAKLFGRPFGPQVHFGTACADMESRLKAQGFTSKEDGPVVDARRTPQGWTVDD
ncbi:MAG: hypothetical protein GDA39_09915, partial [Hyphomonadaceae bacterium]|nr:hypothetical protein [Hyphomonadaceae bacterium]